MREKKANALLLKKVFLANDDAILVFFSDVFGQISLFCPRFQRSKTRQSEIDFFRLLELEITENRTQNSLKKATTISSFLSFQNDYLATQTGFIWLEKLLKIVPENAGNVVFFNEIVSIFNAFSLQCNAKFDAFFRIRLLREEGIFPRFDLVRGDTFFDPKTFSFSSQKKLNFLPLSNLSRQTIEFLRRSNLETFEQKIKNLPDENFDEISQILSEIETFHLF